MKGYRKFGIAGLIAGAAVAAKQWQWAVAALVIYTIGNAIERWQDG